jgi:DMSO/TMAO reductase YedYZ molybdopterin-dependent catalytic subunit
MLLPETSRRSLLIGGTAGLLLAGCDRVNQSQTARSILSLAEDANYRSQRLIGRNALATEYSEQELSPFFRPNGTRMPSAPDFQRHLASGFSQWELLVDGLVERPLRLSMNALLSLPQRTQITRHDCVEGWSAIGKWTGPRLASILDLARLKAQARFIVFHCADVEGGRPYYESVDLVDAFHPQTILAHRLNGQALPVENGAPVRLRVERQLGYKHAKFVMRVEARDRIDNLFGGKGGMWEDRAGYQWYAGI